MTERALAHNEEQRHADGRVAAFGRLLAGAQDPERTVAIMADVSKSETLRNCRKDTIARAVYEAVAFGLDPTPALGQVYLVPFKGAATVILGYRGILTLAARAGITITCDVVREGDTFDVYQDTEGWQVRHVVADPFDDDEATIRGAFAVFRGGGKILHVERTPVKAGRELAGKAKPSSPWRQHFAAMLRKTPVRRGFSKVPLETEELQQLAALLHRDAVREGEAFGTSPGPVVRQADSTRAALEAFAAPPEPADEQLEVPAEREPGDDDDAGDDDDSWIDGGPE